jgi:outer membrane phospholipase A
MTFRHIFLLAILLHTSLSLAAEIVVVAPSESVQAGERFLVSVYFNNVSHAEETVAIPAALPARLSGDAFAADLALAVENAQDAASFRLPPGGFRKVTYSGVAPARARGPLTLELAEVAANRPLLAVGPPVAVAQPVAAVPQAAASPQVAVAPQVGVIAQVAEVPHEGAVAQGPDAAAAPARVEAAAPAPQGEVGDSFNPQAVLARFDIYEPMYFAVGSRTNTNAKFQLSFRYRMLWDLNLAYTQTSLWDLQSASKPFYDSAYKPRIFWYRDDVGYRSGWLTRLGLEAGVGHESNGKDGADSRSINIAYVTPRFTFGNPDDYHLLVAPRILGYLEKTDNPDIDDYRGYVDLTMKFGKRNGLLLGAELRRGSQGYSAQLDLSYPLRPLSGDRFGGYLQLQYFNGYGESLLDYNRKLPSQIRFGYMLVR